MSKSATMTIDAIFVVRKIMEKAREREVNLQFYFIDFKSILMLLWFTCCYGHTTTIMLWNYQKSFGDYSDKTIF